MYRYINTLIVAAIVGSTPLTLQATPAPWTCSAGIVAVTINPKDPSKIDQVTYAAEGADYGITSTGAAITNAFNSIFPGSHSVYCGTASFKENSPLEYSWEIATSEGKNVCAYTCRDEVYGLVILEEYLKDHAQRMITKMLEDLTTPRLDY